MNLSLQKFNQKYVKKTNNRIRTGSIVSILYYDEGRYIKEFKGLCLHFTQKDHKQIPFLDLNLNIIVFLDLNAPTILEVSTIQFLVSKKLSHVNNLKRKLFFSREWDSNPRVH